MNTQPRCDFAEDNRYATDCGPACPNRCSVDGDSLWVFWVSPGQLSVAQCASCHHAMTFMAPGSQPKMAVLFEREEYIPMQWPDIQAVKVAFIATRK